MLWHVVLISFKPGISEEKKQEVYDRYQALNEDCGNRKAGILFWRVERNLDLRKGDDLVEIAIFRNWEARETFRAHPKHTELTDILREVADWRLGNIPLNQTDARWLKRACEDFLV